MIILNNQDIPVSNKRMAIECLDAMSKAMPELFAQNTAIILPIVCELTQQLNDWEDFNTNSSFMRFLNTAMTNEHIELENKALSCKTFFLLMSLVIIRANIDIYYADSVIDGLFTISKLFPDQLKEFLATNSSLKFILHEFLHIDGIDLVNLGHINKHIFFFYRIKDSYFFVKKRKSIFGLKEFSLLFYKTKNTWIN